MLDLILSWDRSLFLFLNGLHSPFWDEVMYWISNKYTMIPIYLFILFMFFYKYTGKKPWILILLTLTLILFSDQISVHLFKNVFERYRPCRPESDISHLVHLVRGHCGGKYGFVSSHAANMFALAVFTARLFKPHLRFYHYIIFFCAIIVSYSRIYLGVHYPLDIFAGAFVGTVIGIAFYKIWEELESGNYFKMT